MAQSLFLIRPYTLQTDFANSSNFTESLANVIIYTSLRLSLANYLWFLTNKVLILDSYIIQEQLNLDHLKFLS